MELKPYCWVNAPTETMCHVSMRHWAPGQCLGGKPNSLPLWIIHPLHQLDVHILLVYRPLGLEGDGPGFKH